MGHNNLVKLLIVTLLFSFCMPVKAATIDKITVDKLVSTINTGITTNKLYSDKNASVTAKKNISGLDVTFKTNQESITQSYVYNSADNSLSVTIENYDSLESTANYLGAVYMQIWLYEASQYSSEEVIGKMLNNSDVKKEKNNSAKQTICTLAVDTICADQDETNKKITMHFLMSDLFAQKLNDEFGATKKSTDTKEEQKGSTVDIKNPETGAFANGIALVSICSIALVTIIILKRNNKFYKI